MNNHEHLIGHKSSNKGDIRKRVKHSRIGKFFRDLFYIFMGLGFLFVAFLIFLMATLELPDFNDFISRKIESSTKIYDRTGQVMLYNFHDDIKRTPIPFEDISDNIKKAVISIEDKDFYNHYGISPRAIARVFWIALTSGGEFSQGGSTINQQIIKNSILSREKTITRKVKELLLAVKLDSELSKDEILNIYLNDSPFGGNIYGVEEASRLYFNKSAKDVNLAEAAYLAAIPNSPTYYWPYGGHRDKLEDRKNLILKLMWQQNKITDQEYEDAKSSYIEFKDPKNVSGKAYHFVFMVRDYIRENYGEEAMSEGLTITTTLDWPLQEKAEQIIKEKALENQKRFDASNIGFVAIDPKTGQVLSLVGSRDYFDTEIDGKFNIALAKRQPGSSFKPFIYTKAFEQGLTPETVIYDVPTQFSVNCDAYGKPLYAGMTDKDCYMPVNYDGNFKGAVNIRSALQLSLNVPAVKTLYLTGMDNVAQFAQDVGIGSYADTSNLGLSMALGGGEVSLLEMSNAYATLANNGVYNRASFILEIKDNKGRVLEKYNQDSKYVIDQKWTDVISNVMSDNNARAPAFGFSNALYLGDRPVAAKTGTSNDYRDLWTFGYTPSIVMGIWAGNNNNKPIDKKVAGMVISPVWNAIMKEYLKDKPIEYFNPMPDLDLADKPSLMRGVWCDNNNNVVTELETIKSRNDPQFNLWYTPIHDWAIKNGCMGNSYTDMTNVASSTQIQPQIQITPNTNFPQIR